IWRGRGALALVLALAAGLSASMFLISKGLMIDLGADSNVHYAPYFEEVIRNHGGWLNRYFLQFFYSKGAGTQFIATLLTDPQSLQLVSCWFAFLSALILFQTVRKLTDGDVLFPLLAVAVLFCSEYMTVEFPKPHVVNGAMVLFLAYS